MVPNHPNGSQKGWEQTARSGQGCCGECYKMTRMLVVDLQCCSRFFVVYLHRVLEVALLSDALLDSFVV